MAPIVSVVVANHNGAGFIAEALVSAARQSLREIEIIVVDDASTDRSLHIARELARRDSRIRIMELTENAGPGGARNAAIASARGRWMAVLDSDDIMHPQRLETLVAEAARTGAEITADNVLTFGEGVEPSLFFDRSEGLPRWISISEFVLSNCIYSRKPPLGYLKPLIDLDFLRGKSIAYRPSLRIGEDYDIVARLLARGARYRLADFVGYFYRKHSQSTSHRITAGELEQLLIADQDENAGFDASDRALAQARKICRRSLVRARSFANLVSALKARDLTRALRTSAADPAALTLLRLPALAAVKRLLPARRAVKRADDARRVCLVTRQRIVGNTNGSSAYILSLCETLRAHGFRITFVSPSPATLGRWPFLRFRPETRVFDEILIRGTWRLTPTVYVAKDPRIALAAGLAIAERALVRLGVTRGGWSKPAPYAMSVPWTQEDYLFVARHAPRASRAVIADYAFLTPAIPYALCPRARSLVVMHDLLSARTRQFAETQTADSVTTLDETREFELLGKADAVVAIQAAEAKIVARNLPHTRVILAPMAVKTVTEPQPGDRRSILFVGSNTAPNIVGLRWFLDHAWAPLRQAAPGCELLIAGSVCGALPIEREGVRPLGLVPDLGHLYRTAGVVISPLTVGSGLKIKLIEALGYGKAVVATTTTVAGVEELVAPAVMVTDKPLEFAAAVAALLNDDELRARQSRAAVAVANRWFTAEACYADFVAFVDSPESGDVTRPYPAPTETDNEPGRLSST